MKNNQKVFVSIIIIVIVAVAGYFVVNSKQPSSQETASSTNIADWETYTNAEHGFEFKYPATWIVTDTKANEITITSPNGEANSITFSVSPIAKGMIHNINCQPSGSEDVNSIVDGFHSEECKNLENANGVKYAREIEQEYQTRFLNGYFLNSQESVIIRTILTNAAGNTFPSTASVFDQILSTFKFTEPITTDTANWKIYRNEFYEFKYPPNFTASDRRTPDYSIELLNKNSSTGDDDIEISGSYFYGQPILTSIEQGVNFIKRMGYSDEDKEIPIVNGKALYFTHQKNNSIPQGEGNTGTNDYLPPEVILISKNHVYQFMNGLYPTKEQEQLTFAIISTFKFIEKPTGDVSTWMSAKFFDKYQISYPSGTTYAFGGYCAVLYHDLGYIQFTNSSIDCRDDSDKLYDVEGKVGIDKNITIGGKMYRVLGFKMPTNEYSALTFQIKDEIWATYGVNDTGNYRTSLSDIDYEAAMKDIESILSTLVIK